MRQTKNVTRLAVESMAACTVLATKPDDVNRSVEDMSLCSVVEAWNKDQENEEIRNSTFLSNRHTINQNFVPSEISVIEGMILCTGWGGGGGEGEHTTGTYGKVFTSRRKF